MIIIKTPTEIDILKKSGEISAQVCQKIIGEIKAGITTDYLDKLATNLIKEYNAWPAFLNYQGFPKAICTSVNNQVVHGIPDDYVLKSGDIISIDLGVLYKGYYSDMAVTVGVGKISSQAEKLIKVTQESLWKGIKQSRKGLHLGDIGFVIQQYVESNGFNVVKEFVGHGIGQNLHEDPPVPNFGRKNEGVLLKEGMVLAIEPMVNEGCSEVQILENGWTVVTADGKLSAHFEHSVVITEGEPLVLTKI